MKKYFLIAPVLLITLIFIVFYIGRNVEIARSIDKLTDIKQLSYELELIILKRTILLANIDEIQNYDAILNSNKDFQSRFTYYSQAIHKIKDKKLIRLLQNIEKKNANVTLLYENLKTDITLVNDSIEQRKKSIENIRKEIQRNDITSALDTVVLYTLRELNKLHKEIDFIIQMLFVSAIFLLVFGFTVYIKEIIVSLEAQKLKNELQQFVDALNESAIVSKTDTSGMITYVNKKFCEVSEYSKKELIGQRHNIIGHPDTPKEVFKDMWSTMQDKKVFKATVKNRTKSGGFYFVDTSIMPILNLDGSIKEYLAVMYNVTELVQARNMAIVGEKAKNEFLSNMSHELRTPLNAIVGFSSILSRSIKDEKYLKYLENIQESSANLMGLIDDILDLSKLQSGKFSLDYSTVNLKQSVSVLLERIKVLIENSEIDFRLSIEDNINLSLSCDWLRISQIISNLMSNAIKFTSKGKKVEFKLAYRNSNLCINVIDEGIGLSKEAQEKIFKPFEQADSSTTRKYGGTGLGLSIVLNLIEQMQGKISLDSAEGKGSNFEVILPLEEVKTLKTSADSEDKVSKRDTLYGHVLVAEDDETNQMLVGVFMQDFGLSCEIANDGVEAVNMFGNEKFDLVLMDENMPNLNGCDAMQKIHSLYGCKVPIIALTANAMTGDREKFLEAGMDDYISKPIDVNELYRVIKKYLS